uniref:Uncharacterized protein n=1 Tax=Physcomitrium patens TaxID=3218 RepID=A0A2K1KDZ4_PHYPA|nr:hypothetical protein PHYPA_008362 [Physcomitrium patens]
MEASMLTECTESIDNNCHSIWKGSSWHHYSPSPPSPPLVLHPGQDHFLPTPPIYLQGVKSFHLRITPARSGFTTECLGYYTPVCLSAWLLGRGACRRAISRKNFFWQGSYRPTWLPDLARFRKLLSSSYFDPCPDIRNLWDFFISYCL